MNWTALMPSRARLAVAGMTALSGGIVSVAMVAFGGSMARYLPSGEGFHSAAVVGAGLAGLLCAGGFGRRGKRGLLVAAMMAVIATFAGAMIGATMMGVFAGTLMGYALGIIALLDASQSLITVAVWCATMATLHFAAGWVRACA